MRSYIFYAAFLFPLSVVAEPKVPTVICKLSWDLRDSTGASIETEFAKPLSVGVEENTSTLNGFGLSARLQGGGPSNGKILWYDLNISLERGVYKASRSDNTTKGPRQSLSLTAGREQAFVNCDINP